MATICQIGCGMIGKVMALDISKRHDLHLSDIDSSALKEVKTIDPTIKTKCFNVNDYDMLESFLNPADIVLLAVTVPVPSLEKPTTVCLGTITSLFS